MSLLVRTHFVPIIHQCNGSAVVCGPLLALPFASHRASQRPFPCMSCAVAMDFTCSALPASPPTRKADVWSYQLSCQRRGHQQLNMPTGGGKLEHSLNNGHWAKSHCSCGPARTASRSHKSRCSGIAQYVNSAGSFNPATIAEVLIFWREVKSRNRTLVSRVNAW